MEQSRVSRRIVEENRALANVDREMRGTRIAQNRPYSTVDPDYTNMPALDLAIRNIDRGPAENSGFGTLRDPVNPGDLLHPHYVSRRTLFCSSVALLFHKQGSVVSVPAGRAPKSVAHPLIPSVPKTPTRPSTQSCLISSSALGWGYCSLVRRHSTHLVASERPGPRRTPAFRFLCG